MPDNALDRLSLAELMDLSDTDRIALSAADLKRVLVRYIEQSDAESAGARGSDADRVWMLTGDLEDPRGRYSLVDDSVTRSAVEAFCARLDGREAQFDAEGLEDTILSYDGSYYTVCFDLQDNCWTESFGSAVAAKLFACDVVSDVSDAYAIDRALCSMGLSGDRSVTAKDLLDAVSTAPVDLEPLTDILAAAERYVQEHGELFEARDRGPAR